MGHHLILRFNILFSKDRNTGTVTPLFLTQFQHQMIINHFDYDVYPWVNEHRCEQLMESVRKRIDKDVGFPHCLNVDGRVNDADNFQDIKLLASNSVISSNYHPLI